MIIVILANRDIESNVAINYILGDNKLKGNSNHKYHIFLSDQVGRKNASKPPKDLRDLKFFEQDLFNRCLFPLLERLPEKDRGDFRTFNELGAQSLNRINSAAGVRTIRELGPDLILSIRYGKRIKEKIISLPQHGILNLHSGILPHYRGVLATFRALLAGEQEIGCTLHYITDSEIDTGSIVARSRFSVDTNKSLLWHVLRIYEGGCALLTEALGKIEAGESPQAIPQGLEEGAYYSFPEVGDLEQFQKMGCEIFHGDEVFELLKDFMKPNAILSSQAVGGVSL